MACGTPLIASDLPVVRELAAPDQHAILVRPGSGKAIKDGLLRLRHQRGLADYIASNARGRVENRFDWSHAQTSLLAVYHELLDGYGQGALPAARLKNTEVSHGQAP